MDESEKVYCSDCEHIHESYDKCLSHKWGVHWNNKFIIPKCNYKNPNNDCPYFEEKENKNHFLNFV